MSYFELTHPKPPSTRGLFPSLLVERGRASQMRWGESTISVELKMQHLNIRITYFDKNVRTVALNKSGCCWQTPWFESGKIHKEAPGIDW